MKIIVAGGGWSTNIGNSFFKLGTLHILKQVLPQADALVAVSDDTKQFMIKNYHFPSECISVVPLGADTRLFHFDEKARYALRAQFEFAEDDVIVIYAGKLVPAKGPDVLVRAALPLMVKNDHWNVFMVGNGPQDYLREMKSWTAQAGLTHRFIWQDVVPNELLPKYYSAADIGVWPRASSLTMVEAQACGLPIIVSDFPAAAERVKHGNGLIYREGDISDLSTRLEKLFNDKELRHSMGKHGMTLVRKTLDYRVLSKRLLELSFISRLNRCVTR